MCGEPQQKQTIPSPGDVAAKGWRHGRTRGERRWRR